MIPYDVPSAQQLQSGGPFEAQFWLHPGQPSPAQSPELSGGVVLESYRGRYLGLLRCDLPPELGAIPGCGLPVQVKGIALTKQSGRIVWIDEIRPLEVRRIVCGANLLSHDQFSSENRSRLARLVAFHQNLFPLTLRELVTRILVDPAVRSGGKGHTSVIEVALAEVEGVFLLPREHLNGRVVNTAGVILAIQGAIDHAPRPTGVVRVMPAVGKGGVGNTLRAHLDWLKGKDPDTYRHLRFMLMAVELRSRQLVDVSLRSNTQSSTGIVAKC